MQKRLQKKAKKKGMTFLEVEKNRMLLTCAGVSAEKYEDANETAQRMYREEDELDGIFT